MIKRIAANEDGAACMYIFLRVNLGSQATYSLPSLDLVTVTSTTFVLLPLVECSSEYQGRLGQACTLRQVSCMFEH